MMQDFARGSRDTSQRMDEQFGDVHRRLDELGPDHYVIAAHSEQARRELNLLLKQRSLSPERVRQELITLTQRVTDGDLRYVERSVRAEVQYWSARLHATQSETLSVARHYLEQLRQTDPRADARIIDALILDAEENVDGALQMLRDIDTPDGRATFFATLSRRRGAEMALLWFDEQPERENANFLTGLGWSNVAVCLAKMDRWEESAARLAAAQEHIEEWPYLAFVEGVVNAAMLFSVEWRQHTLETIPFYEPIRPIEGVGADRHRARSRACFEKAKDLLVDINQPDHAQGARDWLLWLRLTDSTPTVVHAAQQEIQEGMHDGRRAVDLIPCVRTFGIEFNDTPLQRYLTQRKQIGGLDRRELLAEFFLAELRMTPRDYAEFLEREEERLSQVVSEVALAGKRIEALAQDGQLVRARNLLEERRDHFVGFDYERLKTLIDSQEGIDPRAQLEALYRQTNSLIDLQNLVAHLKRSGDWTALQPLLHELFSRERTIANALQCIASMRYNPQINYADIISFLEVNQDMVDRSLDLASEKAWALSHIGRLKEAESINRRLLESRDNSGDLLLATNIALQLGDWERFPAVINRVWPTRETLDPSLLMRLASFAAEVDTIPRALDLAKLAAAKAGNDPGTLLSAYTLGVQLGREEETGTDLLARAIELSSDDGPVWRVNIRTMAEEMLPKRREHVRTIEQELLRGKVPLHAAAHTFHQSLSYLLLGLPRTNAEQSDGRRRTVVPIISGARQPVPIRPSWAVGFDVTSLMVLHYLGLLKKTINAVHRAVLAPDTMVLLLNERRSVRFHQPSLVKKAEEIRALIDRGDLQIELSLPDPPAWLVDEVGRDLAELLAAARVSGGRVVHPYPVHKLRTFGEVEAELREYAEYLVSTSAFTDVLHTRGLIDGESHARACRFLRAHDRDPHSEADPTLLDRPFYLDDLALGYLQEAGILQAACRRELTLYVHPATKDYQSALIEAHREGTRLAETLDELRRVLRDALESNQAIFLPRRHVSGDGTPLGWLHEIAPVLAQFLADVTACDAMCIDDRFANRHPVFTDEAGHTVPLVCVLDLLQYLEEQNVISSDERQRALYKLRQGGYALVPVPPDELEKYVRSAQLDQAGRLIESAEMRLLRQTLMRVRSLDMVELPTEASFLEKMQLGCIVAIRRLWADETLSAERVVALSHWVWCNVAPSPLDWARNICEPLRAEDMPAAFARHLALLLQPMHLPRERHEVFRNWVEHEILESLLPANANLVDGVVGIVKTNLERLIEELSDGASSPTR
jgi:tetratricopeptide (TPR) repeat protein